MMTLILPFLSIPNVFVFKMMIPGRPKAYSTDIR